MHFLIGYGVRLHTGLDEGQGNHAVFQAVTILAVVEQAHAVMAFGEVHPLLAAAFKPRLIPACIGVHLPDNAAELNIKGRFITVHIHREFHLEKMLMLLPVHLGLKVNAAAVCIEMHLLPHLGLAGFILQGQGGAYRAVLCPGQIHEVIHRPGLFCVKHIDVPVVIVHGLVLKHPHEVTSLAGLDDFPVVFLVENGNKMTVCIQSNGIEGGFQMEIVLPGEGRFHLNGRLVEGLVALGGEVFQVNQRAVGSFLHRVQLAAFVRQSGCVHAGQGNYIAAVKAQGIEHGHAVSLAGEKTQPLLDHCAGFRCQLGILPLGDFIDLMNGAAGENIVELVEQNHLPQTIQGFCGVIRLILRQSCQQFQIHEHQLALPIGTLIPRHGSVGAAMVLKVKFAFPGFQPAVIRHALLQFIEIGAGKCLPDGGNALHALFHTHGGFQHGAGGTAAAVAVAVGNENIVIDFLILVALPAAHQRAGVEHTVIRGEEILLGVLIDAQGGDKVRQNLAAVNAAPDKRIVGYLIRLIPGQLCGHEIVDAASFHDLGQSAGVAEHIGQPQNAVIQTKFVLEETLAVDKLPHQRLAGGEVGIGFQPHTAFRLPASLFHAFLDFFKHFRIAFLEELIKNWLAGHKFIVRVLLHELQNRGKAAHDLFSGLGDRPPPRHVDVGMADAGGNHFVMTAHFLIEILGNIGLRLADGSVEGFRVGGTQIQEIDGFVQHGLQIQTDFAVRVHPGERL